jgi:hypothetical protein
VSVSLHIDRARLRRWHLDLTASLQPGQAPELLLADGPGLPSSVETLFSLERLIHRLPGPRSSDRLDGGGPGRGVSGGRKSLLVDFACDAAVDAADFVLRPRYDGVADEVALLAALIEGRLPRLEIERVGDGAILAEGLPSIESARCLIEAYEAVVARVGTLLRHVVATGGTVSGRSIPVDLSRPGRGVIAYKSRALATAAVRALYRMCCFAPHWRIGWRFVTGVDVWDAGNLGGAPWVTLPDPGNRFYADPVPFVWQGRTHLFVEDFDHRTQKGIISAISFGPDGPEGAAVPVLEEPWHLSYPFLIEHDGAVWMIPESSADRTVKLYRADPFPTRWTLHSVLIENVDLSDATILQRDGVFWLFGTTRDGAGSHSDTLSIYMAESLFGPWQTHPANPVLVDSGCARPAGNMVLRNGRLWRPAQDCRGGYGRGLALAEVTRLDREGFTQVARTTIYPGADWPGRRLHTLNRAGALECIDGSAHSPKLFAKR